MSCPHYMQCNNCVLGEKYGDEPYCEGFSGLSPLCEGFRCTIENCTRFECISYDEQWDIYNVY